MSILHPQNHSCSYLLLSLWACTLPALLLRRWQAGSSLRSTKLTAWTVMQLSGLVFVFWFFVVFFFFSSFLGFVFFNLSCKLVLKPKSSEGVCDWEVIMGITNSINNHCIGKSTSHHQAADVKNEGKAGCTLMMRMMMMKLKFKQTFFSFAIGFDQHCASFCSGLWSQVAGSLERPSSSGNSKPGATLPGSCSSSRSHMGTPVKPQAGATAGSHQREKLRMWVFPPQQNPARLSWHHLLFAHANVSFSIFSEDKGIKQTCSGIERLVLFDLAFWLIPHEETRVTRLI